jgi:hypothetical protein
MAHYALMSIEQETGSPDYLQARRPSRVYQGCGDGAGRVVMVSDSALEDRRARPLCPDASRTVKDVSEHFGWGGEGPDVLQLALALLLDVSGDADTALKWCERFAATYVGKLSDTWTVPEVDIALWLYCFENARPGS